MPNWCNNTIEIKGSKEDAAKVKELFINNEGKVDFSIVEPMPTALMGAITLADDGQYSLNKSIANRVSLLNPDEFVAKITELYKEHGTKALKVPNLKELIELEPFFDANTSIEESIALSVNNKIKEKNAVVQEHTNWYQFYTPAIKEIISIIDAAWEISCIDELGFANWYKWSVSNWGTKWNAGSYTGAYEYNETDGNGAINRNVMSYDFDTAWSMPSAWLETFLNRVDALEDVDVEIVLTYAEGGCWFGGTVTRDNDGHVSNTEFDDEEIKEFLSIDDEDCEDYEDEDEDANL